jgi:hypothetical protein
VILDCLEIDGAIGEYLSVVRDGLTFSILPIEGNP